MVLDRLLHWERDLASGGFAIKLKPPSANAALNASQALRPAIDVGSEDDVDDDEPIAVVATPDSSSSSSSSTSSDHEGHLDVVLGHIVAAPPPEPPRSAIVSTGFYISQDAQEVVRKLSELKGFEEYGNRINVLDLGLMTQDAINELLTQGIASSTITEFGEQAIALKASTVTVEGHMRCGSPVLLMELPTRSVAFNQLSRLEVLRHLMRCKWVAAANPAPYTQGAPLEFALGMFHKSLKYFITLCLADRILSKPGAPRHILHFRPDNYYHMLLHCNDLSKLSALADGVVKSMTDKQFKELMHVGVAGALPLAFSDEEEEDDVLVDAPVAPPPIPLPAVIEPVPVGEPSITRNVAGRPMTVRCDNFSHETGRRRAYTTCEHHDACQKWVFIDNYENKRHATAFLFAWQMTGARWPHRGQGYYHTYRL